MCRSALSACPGSSGGHWQQFSRSQIASDVRIFRDTRMGNPGQPASVKLLTQERPCCSQSLPLADRDRPVVLTRQVSPRRGTKQNPCLSASLRKRKPSVKAPRAGSKPPRSRTRSRLTRAVPGRIQLSILRRRLRTSSAQNRFRYCLDARAGGIRFAPIPFR